MNLFTFIGRTTLFLQLLSGVSQKTKTAQHSSKLDEVAMMVTDLSPLESTQMAKSHFTVAVVKKNNQRVDRKHANVFLPYNFF